MKKISDKLIIDNKHRCVHECLYELEGGEIANFLTYGNSGEHDAVAILARTRDGNFILIDEYRVGPEKIVRSCVLGGHEPGQTIETTAKHELQEEAGCSGGELYPIGKVILGGYLFGYAHLYLANNIIPLGKQSLEAGEEISPVALSQGELEEEILTGKIECSKTISIYFLAKEKTRNFTCFDF